MLCGEEFVCQIQRIAHQFLLSDVIQRPFAFGFSDKHIWIRTEPSEDMNGDVLPMLPIRFRYCHVFGVFFVHGCAAGVAGAGVLGFGFHLALGLGGEGGGLGGQLAGSAVGQMSL